MVVSPAKIAELTNALEMVSPKSAAWLDRDTGRVWIIQHRIMAIAAGESTADARLGPRPPHPRGTNPPGRSDPL